MLRERERERESSVCSHVIDWGIILLIYCVGETKRDIKKNLKSQVGIGN